MTATIRKHLSRRRFIRSADFAATFGLDRQEANDMLTAYAAAEPAKFFRVYGTNGGLGRH